jgi:hypothetical protein
MTVFKYYSCLLFVFQKFEDPYINIAEYDYYIFIVYLYPQHNLQA